VLFANAASGERPRRQAGPDAAATANRVDVTAEDGFGQRVARQVVVRRRPTPVVIGPGWATSMPADPFDIPDVLFHRGYSAAKLAATWLVYGPLQGQLAAAGYAKGRDQFLVPYDWRLPIAPFDGLLSLATAAVILEPEPT